MAKMMSRYEGLTRRDTYEEILSYLERGGPNIPFPDRTASFIRASPEYQNLLTYDFIDIQKQQENMLKQQKKNIIIKEQASESDSGMKSILASSSPAQSVASEQVQSDLSAISVADVSAEDFFHEMDDFMGVLEREEMAKRGKAGMKERINEVTQQHEHLGGLRDSFRAAQVTGTLDYSGATSNKFLEKHVAEGQRLDQVRVLPASMKDLPPYISELSKNPKDIAKAHEYFGLSPDPQTQGAVGAASSSSRGRSRERSITSERRQFLEGLNFTQLKAQAKAANVRVPSGMRAKDSADLIDIILKEKHISV